MTQESGRDGRESDKEPQREVRRDVTHLDVETTVAQLRRIGLTSAEIENMRDRGDLGRLARLVRQQSFAGHFEPWPSRLLSAAAAKRWSERWAARLERVDREAAIAAYGYTTGGLEPRMILQRPHLLTSGEAAFIAALDRSMDRGVRRRRSFVVLRGCSLRIFGNQRPVVGQVVTDDAYTATTHNRDVAEQFANSRQAPGVVMRITVPGNHGAAPLETISHVPEEYEILLRRATSLLVTAIRERDHAARLGVAYDVDAIVLPNSLPPFIPVRR